ncbi:hypothetical protein JCM19992_08240 [Thermostilla marina]
MGIGLAAVAATYWLYAWAVVPWIEPSPAEGLQASSGQFGVPADVLLDRRLAELAPLFPGRTDVLARAKMLESEDVKLLLVDYHNLGDGVVQIKPCYVVYAPRTSDGRLNPETAVVLEAPQGAKLIFDQSLDLRLGRIGRLLEGQLVGPVLVRSRGKADTPADDFTLTTQMVRITKDRIWSNSPLEVAWGPHRVRGQGMVITLRSDKSADDFARSGMGLSVIDKVTLSHVDGINLDMRRDHATPSSGRTGGDGPVGDDLKSIELRCAGSLVFSPQDRTVVFNDDVRIRLQHYAGEDGSIGCDYVTVFFAERAAAEEKLKHRDAMAGIAPLPRQAASFSQNAPPASRSPGESKPSVKNGEDARLAGFDWVLEGIKASGNPVRVALPQWRAAGSGNVLEYSALDETLLLDGKQEVSLEYDAFRMTAASVRYRPDGDGLGFVVADGPGRIETLDPRAGEFSAQWRQSLQVRPDGAEQVVSLLGGALLSAGPEGAVQAEEIWCWLQRRKTAARPETWRPARMLALRNVQFRSARVDAATERLETWFVEEPDESETPPVAAVDRQAPSGNTAVPLPSPLLQNGSPEKTQDERHFDVSAGIVRVELGLRGNDVRPRAFTLDGDVQLAETGPASQGLRLTGDHVEVKEASQPSAVAVLTGRPARIEGRGMVLTGGHVYLDRGRNHLSVEGAGSLRLPIARDLQGNNLPQGRPLDLSWRRGMSLDGSQGVIQGEVVAATDRQRVQTETLEIYFDRPLPFGEAQDADVQVDSLRCTGGVVMENRATTPEGQPAVDRFELPELRVDLKSGLMQGPGPGRLVSLRKGKNPWGDPTSEGRETPAAAPGRPALPGGGDDVQDDDKLPYALLAVEFRDEFGGNVFRRQLFGRGRVKVVYGRWPTDRIDVLPDDPADLGKQGMIVYGRELSLVQMPSPLEPQRRYWELQATGNVMVEGRVFTARAERLAFDESKQLLILDGEGRGTAQLFRQEYVGGPVQTTAAQRIVYSHATNTLQFYNAKILELGGFPGGDGAATVPR